MQVDRQFLDVKERQILIELPASFLNRRVEVIAIALDEELGKPVKLRRPHPELAGKGRTLGDLVSPIVDEADWECLQ